MNTIDPYLLIGGAAVVALLVGFLLGRAGRPARKSLLALQASVAERDERIGVLESAQQELEAHREELGLRLIASERESEERREQLAEYQAQVVGHFNQTSDLLKEMTVQYRNIYQHLAEGAEALCPDGTLRLERDTPIDGLLGRSADEGVSVEPILEEDPDAEESVSAAHRDAPLQVDPRPDA